MWYLDDNSNLKKGVKELLWYRRPVGINIIHSLRGPVYAYQLYDCLYTDGHSEVRRGNNLRTYHGFQDLNGTKAEIKEAASTLRTDLEPVLLACHTLLERVSIHCENMDLPIKPKSKKKGKKR